MTDIPSGSKRSYEGDHDRDWKRRRDDSQYDKSRPRDWRDIHLKSDRYRGRELSRDTYRDHGNRSGYYRDEHYRRESREQVRGREKDAVRDRHNDRDRRDRDKDKDKDKERHTDRSRRRSRSRNSRIPDSEKKTGNGKEANGISKDRDSEMEEGEISPAPSSPRRGRSPARSTSYISTPRRSTRDSEPPPPPKAPSLSVDMGPELELTIPDEEQSVAQLLAARRAKRAAILAKYTHSLSPAPNTPDRGVTPAAATQPLIQSLIIGDKATSGESSIVQDADNAPLAAHTVSRSATPSEDLGNNGFSLAKETAEESAQEMKGTEDEEQIMAADYDPSLDRREDEARRVKGYVPKEEPARDDMEVDVVEEEEEEIIEEEDEEVEDMFAIATSIPKKKKVKVKKTNSLKPVIATTTLDTAADPEGYYQIILGEQLDGSRYQVFSSLGKGMFSNVVRARVLSGEGFEIGKEVAIKIIRAQESMHRAGVKEVQILNKLRQADPDDKKHVVKLERTFEHRGHLCLVFENLSMNLRDVIKRFGKDIGLNIRAVRAYASQMFLALSLFRKCNIMHADIKPDNILVSENKAMLKICDFGSASDVSENEITPYLVSRFYRAPEIILGLPYDASLDIWSIGCTLYELYTGKILFPGRSNNQMLLLMMELKGRFNSKMTKKAKFGDLYFDEMGGFVSIERDKVTGNDVTRTMHISKPTRDLRARLAPSPSTKLKDDETKMLFSFIDLLDKCLVLDPARRLTPKDALMHPFVRGL